MEGNEMSSKFLAGGVKGLANKSYPEGLAQEAPTQSQPKEDWGPFLARNALQTPANVYGKIRSGLGLGDVADVIARRFAPEQQPQQLEHGGYPRSYEEFSHQAIHPVSGLQALLRGILPTEQQAREEFAYPIKKGLGALLGKERGNEWADYLTKQRAEDYWLQQAAPEAAIFAATGGVSALKQGAQSALKHGGKHLLKSGAIRSGGHVGGELGEGIGGFLGEENKEIGRALGGLAGGVATAAGIHAFENRASSPANREKISATERAEFEQGKSKRLSQAESEAAQARKEFQELKDQRLAQAEKAGKKNVKAKQLAARKSKLELAKEKIAFDKDNKVKIEQKRQEIKDYDAKIEQLKAESQPQYQAAKLLEEGATGTTEKITDAITEVNDNIALGFNPAQKQILHDNIVPISNAIADGTLDVGKGKIIKDNIRSTKRDYSGREYGSLRRELGKLDNALEVFIEDSTTPAHTKAYKQAQKTYKEYNDMRDNRDNFVKQKNQEIRDINKEKFSPEKEVYLQENIAKSKEEVTQAKQEAKKTFTEELAKPHTKGAEYDALVEEIGKQTFEDFTKSKVEQNKLVSTLEEALGKERVQTGLETTGKYGLSALGLSLGYLFGGASGSAFGTALGTIAKLTWREINATKAIMKSNPNYAKQVGSAIKAGIKGDVPKMLTTIDTLGKEIEKKVSHKNEKRSRFLKGGLKFKANQ